MGCIYVEYACTSTTSDIKGLNTWFAPLLRHLGSISKIRWNLIDAGVLDASEYLTACGWP